MFFSCIGGIGLRKLIEWLNVINWSGRKVLIEVYYNIVYIMKVNVC